MRLRLFLIALLAVLLVILAISISTPRVGQQDQANSLVRIYFADAAEREGIVRLGLDIWERHPDHFVALVRPGELRLLQERGFRVEIVQRAYVAPLIDPAYHTVDGAMASLQETVKRYPNIASLQDVGDSWEKSSGRSGRDIWAVRLGSAPQGTKPALLFLGGLHAREMAATEIALQLIAYLTENYGQDPLITGLLDNREVWIIPYPNPDGTMRVMQNLSWRKNTDDRSGGSGIPPFGPGVDLNRNFAAKWGLRDAAGKLVGNVSDDPSSAVYLGTAPFSEPETRAIRDLARTIRPKIMVAYHSYGNLILWPWSYTYDPTPDHPLYSAIAAQLARLTGYSYDRTLIYLNTGDATDWAYQELGTLAFTIEIGSPSDGFTPPYHRMATYWAQNLPAALYLLQIADNPQRVYGPEVSAIRLSPAGLNRVLLEATITDIAHGNRPVVAAEYFIDTLGPDGSGRPLPITPGQGSVTFSTTINLEGLPLGLHHIYLRGQDDQGYWGTLGAASLLAAPPPLTPTVTPVPTPMPPIATPVACTSLIKNGDFEAGTTAWTLSRNVTLDKKAHSGKAAAWLGGYNYANDELYQSVTIPADVISATLSYWWLMQTQEQTHPWDYFYVRLRTPAGRNLTDLQVLSDASQPDLWTKATFDLSAYKGKVIQVYFQSTTDRSYHTSFYLDDVDITVCRSIASVPTPTPAPTPTPEPVPTPSPVCADLLKNGNFEAGITGWTKSPNTNIDGQKVRNGRLSAWLGGYNYAYDTLSQIVTIPATATKASLSYWWFMRTQETSHPWDYFYARLLSPTGAILTTLQTLSDADRPNIWTQATFDLLPYRGRTLQLHFSVTNDNSKPTDFFLDDASLLVCQ